MRKFLLLVVLLITAITMIAWSHAPPVPKPERTLAVAGHPAEIVVASTTPMLTDTNGDISNDTYDVQPLIPTTNFGRATPALVLGASPELPLRPMTATILRPPECAERTGFGKSTRPPRYALRL